MSFFYWKEQKIRFNTGETIGFALFKYDKTRGDLGSSPTQQSYQLFCGIGACQGCLIYIDGKGIVEACMEIAEEKLYARPVVASDRFDIIIKRDNNETL